MSSKILVIPDAHARVDDDLSRFKALGRWIVEERPDVVIQIGDFADMYSLSSYDSDLRKAKIVGDYNAEVNAVHKALSALFIPLAKLQEKQRHNKKKVYHPKTVITLGNHENRYQRVIEQDPIILGGVVSVNDLLYDQYFDIVVPFKEFYEIAGVNFIHYLPNLMGRALGGTINPARGILNHAKQSVVVGHSHLYDHAIATRVDGTRMNGLVAGCFIGGREAQQHHTYATGSSHAWVDGVSVLHNCSDGDYDLEFISTERLLDVYGN